MSLAVVLNEDGIPSPGVLYYQRKGQSDPRQVNHKWAEQTINVSFVMRFISATWFREKPEPCRINPQAHWQAGRRMDSCKWNPRTHYLARAVGYRGQH